MRLHLPCSVAAPWSITDATSRPATCWRASEDFTTRDVVKYMKSLFHAANAVAELSGPPLQERRLMLEFGTKG